MKDNVGRTIDYVRVSVTDRCNLRCEYCMPKEGVPPIPHAEVFKLEEILRLCRIFAVLGASKIKVSGGEPLVRGGVIQFIKELKEIDGIEQVTLTTNGLILEEKVPALIEAGLDRVNISLDTLKPEVFKRITGTGGHEKVLSAIGACVEKCMPVRINTVPIMGVNDGELVNIAALAKDGSVDVRFIELMPIGLAAKFEYISSERIKEKLEAVYGTLVPCQAPGNGPARYYAAKGLAGRIGFISAMSHGFCAQCNRVRLTSNGMLALCLSHDDGVDLKTPMRTGATDKELTDIIAETVRQKPAAHSFNEMPRMAAMNSIGG